MKNVAILLLVCVVAYLYFHSRPEVPAPVADTPGPTSSATAPPTQRSVTATELLQPLYADVLGQDKDSDLIVDASGSVTAVLGLLQGQSGTADPVATQILASSRQLCLLMQQAINNTTQARSRLHADEALHTKNTQFFTAQIEQQWRAGLAEIRSRAEPEWARLQSLESTRTVAVLPENSQAAARSILARINSEAARRNQAKAQAQARARAAAAREAAAPPPPVSRMQRIGGG